MRIVHVITRLIVGGAQENTILTCRGLVEKGHDVTLIAGEETGPEGSLWDDAQRCGCELIRLPSMRRAVRPMNDPRARRELRRIFERLKPDVVHTHSSKAGILGRSAARAARVPIIVHTIHGMSFNRTQRPGVQALYRFLERSAAKHTTALVTVADAMIEQSVAAKIALREKFITIRSGLETDRFQPNAEQRARRRREWGVNDNAVVVGTIARLFENKGYDDIIAAMPEAVRRSPQLRFVWVGDGPNRREYEARLREMGLVDRVRFVGLVRPDEVPSILCGFDLLVHASRWEGLPRAVVQALLTEVPAISFDNDGAPEVVIHGQTGLLVPLGSVDRLSAAIVELAQDPSRRRQLGNAGRGLCLVEFDWRRMVEQLEALYLRMVAKRGMSNVE